MQEPDYLEFWRELVKHSGSNFPHAFNRRDKAEAYETSTRRKNQGRRDTLLDTVINEIKPNDTVLDIGAGTGRWTIPLAKVAFRITAVDPSEAMLEILKRNSVESGVTEKIDIINTNWEQAEVESCDFVICFHAMYMSFDFAGFIHKMEAHAKRRCYLGLRHFPIDGIIQELSLKINGSKHDSPNFIIGYNALCQMGIYPNVTIENFRHHWIDDSFEAAFNRAKRHLLLEDNPGHDTLIKQTLKYRLEEKDGVYRWPDSMTTALVWWDPHQENH
jgi:SAM-dependent methyltransferase